MQTTKRLVHIHFGDTVRGAFQAVIFQIKAQGKHYFSNIFPDPHYLLLIGQYKGVLTQWGICRGGYMLVSHLLKMLLQSPIDFHSKKLFKNGKDIH